MKLETIEVHNFRNLRGNIDLGDSLTILVGENGHGKTNWLEAISVLSWSRSFRTARLQEAISFNENSFAIRGTVRESPEITRGLGVIVEGNSKTMIVNNKREPTYRYLGHLHSVVFNADELEVIRGNPDSRRRFLDDGIVSLHPPFVQVVADYNRVIKQKNALLGDARDQNVSFNAIRESLDPWNVQLATLASRIHRSRMRFVERVNGILEKRLFGREELAVRYISSLEGKADLSDYETAINERLAYRLQAEVSAGHALVGPHRDDLEITFDGHDIRKYGSAGQQRSALLLLQLANIAVFHATHGEYPLFLIDDIDAELDYGRIGKLLEFLDGKSQTIATTSKESLIDKFGAKAGICRIENGSVKSL